VLHKFEKRIINTKVTLFSSNKFFTELHFTGGTDYILSLPSSLSLREREREKKGPTTI